jgi:hypothetical protein
VDGAALQTAVNAHGNGDTITLVAGCTYTLASTTGFNSFNDTLTIQGNGATINRSSASAFRFFDVFSAPGNLTLSNVTVSNGGGASFVGDGGAISLGGGNLTITNSAFLNNSARFGGALALESSGGTITITGSTFSGNVATQVNGLGGAIENGNSAAVTLVVINSTFTGNSAPKGAAFYNNGGTASFINTTISGNTTTAVTSGAFDNNSRTATVTNSIISNNAGPNCGTSSFTDGGYNLENGTTCHFTTHAVNADPALAALASNGGPTQTMAIATTSPAHDAANLSVCSAATPSGASGVDQRGVSRAPTSGETACDIGAFEVLPPPAPAPVIVAPRFTG